MNEPPYPVLIELVAHIDELDRISLLFANKSWHSCIVGQVGDLRLAWTCEQFKRLDEDFFDDEDRSCYHPRKKYKLSGYQTLHCIEKHVPCPFCSKTHHMGIEWADRYGDYRITWVMDGIVKNHVYL